MVYALYEDKHVTIVKLPEEVIPTSLAFSLIITKAIKFAIVHRSG